MYATVIPAMLLLSVLDIVFHAAVVTSENSNHKPSAPTFNYSSISLAPDHVPYFLYNNKKVAKQCRLDPHCPFKQFAKQNLSSCWGYEKNCERKNRFSYPICTKVDSGWVDSLEAAQDLFWKQADFGYVKERRSELKTLCKATKPGDSSLRCTSHARFCKATNLYLDMRKPRRSQERYKEDFIQKGEIGGHCKLNKQALAAAGEHKSPLQSWYAELQTYTELEFHPLHSCDVIIEKPTVFMKLDAGVNMYHHFCDFVNLYISQHINNSFSTDINIIMWDTSFYEYGDLFREIWKVFSESDIIHLKTYDSKKVCFKDAFLSLLPRMRYGLFYNTPLCLLRSLQKVSAEIEPIRFKGLATLLVSRRLQETSRRRLCNQQRPVSPLGCQLVLRSLIAPVKGCFGHFPNMSSIV